MHGPTCFIFNTIYSSANLTFNLTNRKTNKNCLLNTFFPHQNDFCKAFLSTVHPFPVVAESCGLDAAACACVVEVCLCGENAAARRGGASKNNRTFNFNEREVTTVK